MNKKILKKAIQKPFDFSSIEAKEPFTCLLYSNQENITNDEMISVANWLINSGCRYAVCAGIRCEEWHDAIDDAYILTTLDALDDSSQFLMTTWHKDETIDEIVSFWLNSINYDDNSFKNYLLLTIGESKDINPQIEKAITQSEDN